MAGELKEDIVTIADQKEGSQLYNKGNYGYPISRGGLDLDMVEATYLLECGRLEVKKDGVTITFEEMFKHASAVHEDFDIRYLVYRDIRQRGFIVKNETGGIDMSIYPRGMLLSNSRPEYLVKAVSERTAGSLGTFHDEAVSAEERKKKLLYAVVDEEGDLTYYVVSSREPKGRITVSPSAAVHGELIRDRVFVFDTDNAERIHGNGYFGKMMDGTLQLSLIESVYLVEKSLLNVRSSGTTLTARELKDISDSVQNEFEDRLSLFSDLRDKGLLVKTGFKYGTHFRVYEDGPDRCHARYLVHSVRNGERMTWPEISRTVRLAHGVKKEILFFNPAYKGYTEFKRFRP